MACKPIRQWAWLAYTAGGRLARANARTTQQGSHIVSVVIADQHAVRIDGVSTEHINVCGRARGPCATKCVYHAGVRHTFAVLVKQDVGDSLHAFIIANLLRNAIGDSVFFRIGEFWMAATAGDVHQALVKLNRASTSLKAAEQHPDAIVIRDACHEEYIGALLEFDVALSAYIDERIRVALG